MKDRKIIAILRGITKADVIEVAQILINAGINNIEVTLNSPDAFASIKTLTENLKDTANIGAGTVLKAKEVEKLASFKYLKFIITPNCDLAVIKAAKKHSLKIYPGVFSPTECYEAINNGADGLKFFPAHVLGVSGFKAIKAILPANLPTYAVGGIGTDDFAKWFKAGITGFGIGSFIYSPHKSPYEIGKAAQNIVKYYDKNLI